MNAIEVERLGKRYLIGEDRPGRSLQDATASALHRLRRAGRPPRDEVWSLRDVTLSVRVGEAIGVVGRNGAGKSTLLKILARITEPTEGVARTRGRVTSLLEIGTGFHPELTGRENVYLNGALLGMPRAETARRFDEIVSFAGVERFIDTPVKRYSSGMYLRLAFAVAAHLEPDILVVDEVLAVGDAEFQARCLGRMESVERSGRTVVFVSHNLDAIARLCGRAIWLDEGRVVADGPSADVVHAYLTAQTRRVTDDSPAEDRGGPIAIHGVGLRNATGADADVLRREEPFSIEVRFTLRERFPGLDVAIQVGDTGGGQVLNEAWSDRASVRPDVPGTYVARVDVPPVLNVGEYVVGLWIGNALDTLIHERTIARFRLEGDPHNRPLRSVVLGLPWTVERAEPADARHVNASPSDRSSPR